MRNVHINTVRKVGVHKRICSKCGGKLESHRVGVHAYCLRCHATYMRENRPRHSELPDEAKRKANARAYTHVYIKRGKIQKGPCEVCGSEKAQSHHDDYNKPTEVRWFCRPHHLQWHKHHTAII